MIIKFVPALILAISLLIPRSILGDHQHELLLDIPSKKVRALNIRAYTLEGEKINLLKLRGKMVFLNFWATWCAPCREEMPAMERLAEKLKEKPFVMLAVNLQEPKILVKKFVEDLGLSFTIIMDPSGKIGENYKANNLPLTYIIDKKGFIIRRAIGARVWDSEASLHLFEELMAKKKK